MYTYTPEQVRGLTGWIPEAIRQAIAARQHAWAPLSKVRVGAAIAVKRGDTHQIFTGCNVEWSTSVELHAAKVAIGRMVTEMGFDPKQQLIAGAAIAYVGVRDDQHALQCGCCRQVLMDFGGPGIMVFGAKLATDDATEPTIVEGAPLYEILPYAFTTKHFLAISDDTDNGTA